MGTYFLKHRNMYTLTASASNLSKAAFFPIVISRKLLAVRKDIKDVHEIGPSLSSLPCSYQTEQ